MYVRVYYTQTGQQLNNVFSSAAPSKYHLGTLQISIFHFQTEGTLTHLENLSYEAVAYENMLFPKMPLCLSFHVAEMCCGCADPTNKPLTFL